MICTDLATRIEIYLAVNPSVTRILVHPDDIQKKAQRKKIAAKFPNYTFKVLGYDAMFSHENFVEQAEEDRRERLNPQPDEE